MKFIGITSWLLALHCLGRALLLKAESSITFDEKYDFLQTLKDDFSNSTDEEAFVEDGADGFGAFRIDPQREIVTNATAILPEVIPDQFFISTVFKPDTANGFLFAVLDSEEKIVQLGLELVPTGPDITNITFLYTDPSIHSTSQTIASFATLGIVQQWSRLFLNVEVDEVSLYVNCTKVDAVKVQRDPMELILEENSVLRVGQAGPLFKGEYKLHLR